MNIVDVIARKEQVREEVQVKIERLEFVAHYIEKADTRVDDALGYLDDDELDAAKEQLEEASSDLAGEADNARSVAEWLKELIA